METDDVLYRRYLDGDEGCLSTLIEHYGDKLTSISTATCTTFTRPRN